MFIWEEKKEAKATVCTSLCQLQIGTYQEHHQGLNNKGICHLPLRRLNPLLLPLLTFSNPQGSSGWSQALCAPGNLVGQVFG